MFFRMLVRASITLTAVAASSLALASERLPWDSLDSSCGVVTISEEGTALILSVLETSGHGGDELCRAHGRAKVPKGYALSDDLVAALTADANFEKTGDRATIFLRIQTGTLSDLMKKTLTFATDKAEDTAVTLSGTAKIPSIGNCTEDLSIGVHVLASIRTAADTGAESKVKLRLKSLALPALTLKKLECPEQ